MRQLRTLLERPLAGEQWVALFLDGKTFAQDELVIALGVTVQGEKRVLGFIRTATENRRVCAAFLRKLVERGFQAPDGLLVVLDGAKGLRAAVAEVFAARAQVQRCQWHKRENIFVTFSDLPLKFATWLGLSAFIVGGVSLVAIVLGRIFGGITVSGFASVMAGIVAFGGMQLLILGIVGEYLGRMNFKSSKKPLFLVGRSTDAPSSKGN